jgi:predicted NUDIX family phosphoesterase
LGKKATIVAFRDEDLQHFTQPYTPATFDDVKDLPVWLGPRPFLETYPAYRQLLPYVVVKDGDKYFNYRRAASGGEARLHGNMSMGIGGHVDAEDIVLNDDGAVDVIETIKCSMGREIYEEIAANLDTDGVLSVIGVIRAFDNDVDLHHFAVVCLFDITGSDTLLMFEETLGEPSFNTLEETMNNPVEKETWTRLVLEYLTNVQ